MGFTVVRLKTYFIFIFLVGFVFVGFTQSPKKIYSFTDKEELRFEQLTIDEGLCSNEVNDIVEDSKGYVWIATNYGLTRYDGNDFKCYQHSLTDSTSLIHNGVKSIVDDPENLKLWVLTDGGLCYYSFDSDDFTKVEIGDWQYNKDKRTIELDRLGRLWSSDPLGYVEKDSEKFKALDQRNAAIYNDDGQIYVQFFPSKKDPNHLFTRFNFDTNKWDAEPLYRGTQPFGNSNVHCYDFVEDNLWIPLQHQQNELSFFNLTTKTHANFEYPDSVAQREIKGTIFDIHYSESENVIWIGDWMGLVRFDLNKGAKKKIRRFRPDPSRPNTSLSSKEVKCIYSDKRGRLWVGLMSGGVCMFSPKILFDSYGPMTKHDPESLSSGSVNDLFFDGEGNLWVATNKGLSMQLDEMGKKFKNYTQEGDPTKRANKNWIKAIAADQKKEKLYIAYWGDMPNVFNLKTRKFEDLVLNDDSKKLLTVKGHNQYFGGFFFINDVFVDHNDKVWYSCWGNKLICYDPKKKNLIHYGGRGNAERDSINYLTGKSATVFVTKDNLLLLGNTDGRGLQVFDLKTGKVPGTYDQIQQRAFDNPGKYITYTYEEDNDKSISDNNTQCIYEDSNGYIWVGTKNGLNRVNRDGTNPLQANDFIFEQFDERSGGDLRHPNIVSIIEDNDQKLWLGSLHGLYKLDLAENKVISNYTYLNGLQSNEFSQNSCAKGDSLIAFGGIKGFNVFDPNDDILGKIENVDSSMNPIILSVNGVERPLNGELTFYKDRDTTFLFKLNPEWNIDPKLLFEHQLEGKDENPIKDNSYNYPYSNLKAKTYKFKLRGIDNDSFKDIGEPITFTVYPRWERYKVPAGIGIIGGLFLLFWMMYNGVRKNRKRKRWAERNSLRKICGKDTGKVVYVDLRRGIKNDKKFAFFITKDGGEGSELRDKTGEYSEEGIIKNKLKDGDATFIEISKDFWINYTYVLNWEENKPSNNLDVYFKKSAHLPKMAGKSHRRECHSGYREKFLEKMFNYNEQQLREQQQQNFSPNQT